MNNDNNPSDRIPKNMVELSLASSYYVARTAKLFAGNCFYLEIISQISHRVSPVFTCEAFCTGPGTFTGCYTDRGKYSVNG